MLDRLILREPISRRRLLEIGGFGCVGLSLWRLLQARATAATTDRPAADACILLFLNGGPSHLDMWDMKPEAPEGIRGEFQPIASSLAGVPVCEHLPRMAKLMDRCTLVRSMHHTVTNAHAAAVYTSLTGHDRGDPNRIIGDSQDDYPSMGAVMSLLRPPAADRVSHVVLPYKTKEGAKGPPQPGFYGGFLGRSRDPLFILDDPNAAEFSVPELTLSDDVPAARLAGRKGLLEAVDTWFNRTAAQRSSQDMDEFRTQALGLLTSTATREALAIQTEPAAVRDRYGRNIYGQSVLLARRMIEAGTRVVTVSWAPHANATWDTHGSNFVRLKEELLPQFDQACASLIGELEARGLLERTIVAVLGDFGRTPKVNGNKGGRDHWNYCYSVLLAGGGFRPGFVYGASDRIGAFPARDALLPGQLIASIYHQLGVDASQLLRDRLGRPHRLVASGDVVNELIA